MLNLSSARVAAAFEKLSWDVLPGMQTVPRGSYLPREIRDTPPNVDPQGTDLAIWTWASGDRLLGIAFQGKSNKPLFFNRFRSDAERDRTIANAIRDRKTQMSRKVEKQVERRNFKHAIEPGDIYYTSWGYDQTNVDFYEVIAAGDKSISVRPIAQKTTSREQGADHVIAVKGDYTGPAERKVPRANGFTVDNHMATKWDGKPKYQTASGWGH